MDKVAAERVTKLKMKNLIQALIAARQSMPDALKDSTNPHFHSRYASLGAFQAAVNPHLFANGLVVSQTFEPAAPDPTAGPVIVTSLMHISGEEKVSRLFLPATKKDAQGFGSCITYGRRYALGAICGITSEEDDDGNMASSRPSNAGGNPPSPHASTQRAAPAPQSAPPPAATGRKALGEQLMNGVNGDKALASAVLSTMIPGKASPSQLSDHELALCQLALAAAQTPVRTAQEMAGVLEALRSSIRSSTPFHQWTAQHMEFAWKAIRGEGLPDATKTQTVDPVHPDDIPF